MISIYENQFIKKNILFFERHKEMCIVIIQ